MAASLDRLHKAASKQLIKGEINFACWAFWWASLSLVVPPVAVREGVSAWMKKFVHDDLMVGKIMELREKIWFVSEKNKLKN